MFLLAGAFVTVWKTEGQKRLGSEYKVLFDSFSFKKKNDCLSHCMHRRGADMTEERKNIAYGGMEEHPAVCYVLEDWMKRSYCLLQEIRYAIFVKETSVNCYKSLNS